MQDEKWQDPSVKVLNIRYVLLSLTATILLVLGFIANSFPDLLSVLGADLAKDIQANWLVLIVLGVVTGALNAFMTFGANKSSKPTH
jgi:hypothetical protein